MASHSRIRLPPGLDMLVEVVRTLASPPRDDAPLSGAVVADVPVSLAIHYESVTHVEGRLSLRRRPDGEHRLAIEIPVPVWGGLVTPMRRISVSLDRVLDLVWTETLRGGTLTVTALDADALRALPTGPTETVAFQVARRDRRAAEALAHAVALADLPD